MRQEQSILGYDVFLLDGTELSNRTVVKTYFF